MPQATLLKIENLAVSFATETGRLRAVEDVSFTVNRGETMGLVGESGCGKSVTALSVMRLLPKPAGKIEAGKIRFDGTDITALTPTAMHPIRGRRIAMIFQEPMTALNPVHTIGRQLCEVFRLHPQALPGAGRKKMARQAADMLRRVGIPDPERRLKEFPHQISGGMRQRVMIAMALACRPDLLIADEPTTALDVTIQAQILDLIKTAQQESGLAVIFITHDLGVIAETCQRVCVMYAGKIVETADVVELFQNAAHPYTNGLLASIPRLENKRKTRLTIIPGMVPALGEFPPGCRFQNRCGRMQDICKQQNPALVPVAKNHLASCHFPVKQVSS
ncbi:MAG: ABC transporter ATP-binding protein [Thermodesulfobacteriota bacterium]|nr:ABC transporter ATP-binding protein [Thermodesulfobacteriota bacterium]